MMDARIQTLPAAAQDYVSVRHGDARIDAYVTLPEKGVQQTTGLGTHLLYGHASYGVRHPGSPNHRSATEGMSLLAYGALIVRIRRDGSKRAIIRGRLRRVSRRRKE